MRTEFKIGRRTYATWCFTWSAGAYQGTTKTLGAAVHAAEKVLTERRVYYAVRRRHSGAISAEYPLVLDREAGIGRYIKPEPVAVSA